VLTNQESTPAMAAITYHIVDTYMGVPEKDWIASFDAVARRAQAASAAREKSETSARDAASKPSLPLERYAGRYRDAWYGDITIAPGGSGLTIAFDHTPALTGTLEHWQHDTFVARWRDRELRADAFVTFALTPEGGIDTMRMRAVSADTDFSYDFQDLLFRPIK
jgi:hypothetical protein